MNTELREFGMKTNMDLMKRAIVKYQGVYERQGYDHTRSFFTHLNNIKKIGVDYRYYANGKKQVWD
jgi:hypothetical protein